MINTNGEKAGNSILLKKSVEFVKCLDVAEYKTMLEKVKQKHGKDVSDNLLCPPDWNSADFKIGGKFDMRQGNSSAMIFSTRADVA